MLSGKTTIAIFDFYESVIEADTLNLTGIQVSLSNAEGLRLSLNVCCKADLSSFSDKDNILYEKSVAVVELVLDYLRVHVLEHSRALAQVLRLPAHLYSHIARRFAHSARERQLSSASYGSYFSKMTGLSMSI